MSPSASVRWAVIAPRTFRLASARRRPGGGDRPAVSSNIAEAERRCENILECGASAAVRVPRSRQSRIVSQWVRASER
jgi:hypothetical protein